MGSSIKSDVVWRVALVYFVVLLVGLIIIAKALYIQFVEGSDLREKAQEITFRQMPISPTRGDILDVEGRLLATSVPYYELRMDLRAAGLTDEIFYDKVDSLALRLSYMFRDRSPFAYRSMLVNARRFDKGSRYFLIFPRLVNYIELKRLLTFPLLRLPKNVGGFMPVTINKRIRPNDYLAARTIGGVNESGLAVGIEGAYNHELKGQAGVVLTQRIAGRMWIPVNSEDDVSPLDGTDVVTTLDIDLQDVAQSALRRQLSSHNADHGTVILMEVSTGEIRAIANLKRSSDGSYSEAFNYAIGESTEPGSTFKIASLIALLEDGYVKLNDTVDTQNGRFLYFDKWIVDAHEGGLGKLSVEQVFEQSSNVGVAKLMIEHYKGREKSFIDRLYSMKLNEPLGLQIKGEAAPDIKYPGDKYWSGVSLPMMSIGYEVRITPLQLLTFYNAIANGGKMVKPFFVKSLQRHGNTVRTFSPEVISSSICSRSTLHKVKQVLEGVVENGTAKNLKNSTYAIAGKTGTAQIARGSGGYAYQGAKSYQASFVGYFPADNPKYSCMVVVSSPSNDVYYGNVVAGPIFKEIADKVFAKSLEWQEPISHWGKPVDVPVSQGGYRSDLDEVFDVLNIPVSDDGVTSNWVNTKSVEKDKVVELSKRSIINNLVPNVMDMGLKDALFLLENAGLRVHFSGKGTVKSQSLQPGTRVIRGNEIYITLG
jgi:Cell division protein FtsI/penicillin-binding protein 2